MNWLLVSLVTVTVTTTYFAWVRPLLKENTSLRTLFFFEYDIWAAIRIKFAGLKQRLASVLVAVACVVVSAYDVLAPLALQSGIDVTALAPLVPSWAWPLILFGVTSVLYWFRYLADSRT